MLAKQKKSSFPKWTIIFQDVFSFVFKIFLSIFEIFSPNSSLQYLSCLCASTGRRKDHYFFLGNKYLQSSLARWRQILRWGHGEGQDVTVSLCYGPAK